MEWRNKGSGQARQQQIERQADDDAFGVPSSIDKQAHPYDDDIPF